MPCGWCHRSTLDRLVSFGKKGLAEISRIGADFSAPMALSAVHEIASMRAELGMCLVQKRGTLVA